MMFIPNMWTGEQAPPPLPPPWEADTISCGNPLDWKFERAAALSSSPGVWRGRISLRPTLSQIPLKSFGFPGAESARKRFFLRGGKLPLRKNQRPGRPTEIFDFAWSVAKRLACPLGKQPFRRAGRRPRLEVERVHTLSSSPGGCSFEKLISDDASCSFEGFCFRRHGRGALRSPTPPRVTGMREGCDPLALSRGLLWRESWFLTMRAVLLMSFVSEHASVGRSAPLHPLGRRGARGLRPSRALPGAVLAEIEVSDDASCF